ncbi:DegT/DnrJ/EryC1/StrS family aminotransferase [bacterium]|nr:DegT/DnrJ/EryC1/StrS family aminotransferase [candidate division CSSED10-310 bacterium]
MRTGIPLVDLRAQYETIRGEIGEVLGEVLDAADFIMGERVAELESVFAAFCSARYGIGVSSATCGLHLVLHALGIGLDDEVIVPSHTFIATAESVCHCGAKPVFVDVCRDTMTIDPEAVRRAVTPRTRAIIPVHLYGRCADVAGIRPIAEEFGLDIVEDAAQAHGAFCDAGRAGTMGTAAVFSFYPGKNLGAFGDAGMITVNDPSLYQRMHMLGNHGRTSKYSHEQIGFNYRIDALQAAVVSVKLRHLNDWNEQRLERARRYNTAFSTAGCVTPTAMPGHVFHLYVLRVSERDKLLRTLRANDIGAGIHYPIPCHRQPCFSDRPMPGLPVTEALVSEIISLPLYPEMTDEQQDRVIECTLHHCASHDPLPVQ